MVPSPMSDEEVCGLYYPFTKVYRSSTVEWTLEHGFFFRSPIVLQLPRYQDNRDDISSLEKHHPSMRPVIRRKTVDTMTKPNHKDFAPNFSA